MDKELANAFELLRAYYIGIDFDLSGSELDFQCYSGTYRGISHTKHAPYLAGPPF